MDSRPRHIITRQNKAAIIRLPDGTVLKIIGSPRDGKPGIEVELPPGSVIGHEKLLDEEGKNRLTSG